MSGSSNVASDRRTPGLARVPFEALVEIAAPEGESFEAESIDLSASGMHLKTAYLPDVGTHLTFRFESVADAPPILANGEVVWAHDGAEGSEFGVRFGDMKPEGAAAIRRIVGIAPMNTIHGMGALTPQAMAVASASASASAGQRSAGAPRADAISAPPPPTFTDQSQPAGTIMRSGAPVRIHIEGVSSPMRATLRDDGTRSAMVGSDLKMLRIGAVVELEDKERRTRRAARVDGEECEIDPDSQVPQLVVKLRYDVSPPERGAMEIPEGAYVDTKKAPAPMEIEAAATVAHERAATLPPEPIDEIETARDAEPEPLREMRPRSSSEQVRESLPVAPEQKRFDGVTDGMKKVGNSMKSALFGAGDIAARLGTRARTTMALIAKRNAKSEAEEVRRTTSAVGTVGKARTLRPQAASRDFSMGGNVENEEGAMQEIDMKKVTRRKQIGIAAGVGVALMLGFLAFRKPHHAPSAAASAPVPELAPAAAPPPTPMPATASTEAVTALASTAPAALVGESTGVDAKGNPNPFGTTSVKKGTHMVLRLDGPVAELRGMQMPNGFVISVPNRKSLEAAGPLAAKDTRISSAKVVNQAGGAELTIAFKDGAPPYLVKAKGDTIEITLGHEKAVAKKGKGGKGAVSPNAAPKVQTHKKK